MTPDPIEVKHLLATISRRGDGLQAHAKASQALQHLGKMCEAALLRSLQGKFIQGLAQGWLQPDDVWEGYQEALLALWTTPTTMPSDLDKLRGFLYRCAQNKITDLLRRNQTYRNYVTALEESEIALNWEESVADESVSGSPERCAINQQQQSAYEECLEKLGNSKASEILMAWSDGFSMKEIALIVSIPAGSVKSGLHEIKKKMLACLRGKGVTQP